MLTSEKDGRNLASQQHVTKHNQQVPQPHYLHDIVPDTLKWAVKSWCPYQFSVLLIKF